MEDLYLDIIDEHWNKILMMYGLFARSRPVMVLKLLASRYTPTRTKSSRIA